MTSSHKLNELKRELEKLIKFQENIGRWELRSLTADGSELMFTDFVMGTRNHISETDYKLELMCKSKLPMTAEFKVDGVQGMYRFSGPWEDFANALHVDRRMDVCMRDTLKMRIKHEEGRQKKNPMALTDPLEISEELQTALVNTLAALIPASKDFELVLSLCSHTYRHEDKQPFAGKITISFISKKE